MQCHGQAPLMGNLDLRMRETALKGGQHGPLLGRYLPPRTS
jgi:hypothetical protein